MPIYPCRSSSGHRLEIEIYKYYVFGPLKVSSKGEDLGVMMRSVKVTPPPPPNGIAGETV